MNDQHATDLWGGEVYCKIPKSVWATIAWHLANADSGRIDSPGAANARVLKEVQALGENGIISPRQASIAASVIRKASF